jgi:hypothetical protein
MNVVSARVGNTVIALDKSTFRPKTTKRNEENMYY